MTAVTEESQKLSQDAKIALYRLDLTVVGEAKALFSPHALPDGSGVQFGEEVFTPVPIKAEGYSWSGDGDPARPRLRLSGRNPALLALLAQYDGLRGVPVERLVTYRKHLADGDDPDPDMVLSFEIFVIDRANKPRDGSELVFELATPMEQAAVMLPGRVVMREYCPFAYRVWNPAASGGAGGFDYTDVFCPYTGAAMFDVDGNPTADPTKDDCSRQLASGCEVRHPKPAKVPFGGFPGVARVRG